MRRLVRGLASLCVVSGAVSWAGAVPQPEALGQPSVLAWHFADDDGGTRATVVLEIAADRSSPLLADERLALRIRGDNGHWYTATFAFGTRLQELTAGVPGLEGTRQYRLELDLLSGEHAVSVIYPHSGAVSRKLGSSPRAWGSVAGEVVITSGLVTLARKGGVAGVMLPGDRPIGNLELRWGGALESGEEEDAPPPGGEGAGGPGEPPGGEGEGQQGAPPPLIPDLVTRTPCSAVDLAEPFGELTIADMIAFRVAVSERCQKGAGGSVPCSPADLALPYGVINYADVTAFQMLYRSGCVR